jgi:hypothetical protein
MSKQINNERMEAFIKTITSQVNELLSERQDDILKSWHENIEEAQEAEKDFPPLKLSIGVTIDLEGNAIETQVSFTTKYTSKLQARLPDPNQPELPMDGLKKALNPGDSMTVSIDGKEVAKVEA